MRCEASVPLHEPCSVPPGTVLVLKTESELFNVLCNSKIMPDCFVRFAAVPAPTSAAAPGAVGPELLFLEIGHSKVQIRWPFIYIATEPSVYVLPEGVSVDPRAISSALSLLGIFHDRFTRNIEISNAQAKILGRT